MKTTSRRCPAVVSEPEASQPVCPSSLAASSSPLLMRLAHRHELAAKTVSSRARRSLSPLAMSFVVVLLAFIFASPIIAEEDAVEPEMLMEEGQNVTATIAPTSCPSECSCFFTLMFCSGTSRIPPVISPATKFVFITNTNFANPVLTRANFSSGYENVEDIAIQYTNLATIQNQAFDNLRRVRYISLDHNQLRTLPSSMLRVLARAKFVSLFSNQWTCNRNLAWLYEVYRSNPDKFGSGCLDFDCRQVSQVRCSTPAAFRNLDFVNITFAQYQQMQTTQ